MQSLYSRMLIAGLLGLGCLAGCSNNKALPASEAKPIEPFRALIGPGDEIELQFYYASELNNAQRVRQDGFLSLQLVGEVMAAGLTPQQLDAQLEELYAEHLKFPEVAVIVRGQYSQRILIGGEVKRPGAIDMPAGLSLMEAVILAGGFDMQAADVQQVIVIRSDATGLRQGYSVNMKDQFKGAAHTPFQLAAGDIVYVPRTAIADVNQFVKQYINGVVPDLGIIYSRSVGDGTITIDTSSNN